MKLVRSAHSFTCNPIPKLSLVHSGYPGGRVHQRQSKRTAPAPTKSSSPGASLTPSRLVPPHQASTSARSRGCSPSPARALYLCRSPRPCCLSPCYAGRCLRWNEYHLELPAIGGVDKAVKAWDCRMANLSPSVPSSTLRKTPALRWAGYAKRSLRGTSTRRG